MKPHTLSLKDIANLSQARDELALQSHLFKAEARDLWREAEIQWRRLQDDLRAAREALDRNSLEVASATQLLSETLRDTYHDLRNSLKR